MHPTWEDSGHHVFVLSSPGTPGRLRSFARLKHLGGRLLVKRMQTAARIERIVFDSRGRCFPSHKLFINIRLMSEQGACREQETSWESGKKRRDHCARPGQRGFFAIPVLWALRKRSSSFALRLQESVLLS